MKAQPHQPPISLRCAVLTISDRRSATDDTSGDYLCTSLLAAGHQLHTRGISPDNIYQIRQTLSNWIADADVQVIIVNGGTGFSHRKSTVAAASALFDQTINGFGELFRHLSWLDIGSSSLQSDALAGTANNTLIFCIPGSTAACRLAWEKIIADQLDSRHGPCNFATLYSDARGH